jgi:hypothetical protein
VFAYLAQVCETNGLRISPHLGEDVGDIRHRGMVSLLIPGASLTGRSREPKQTLNWSRF